MESRRPSDYPLVQDDIHHCLIQSGGGKEEY